MPIEYNDVMCPLRGERPRNAEAFQSGANTPAKVEHRNGAKRSEERRSSNSAINLGGRGGGTVFIYLHKITILMTKKLFYQDPYKTECEAIVLNVMGPEVTLDQTCFFAFSGGQASDSGSINDIPVKQAIASGDDIVYVLEQVPSFKEGDKVIVKIDENKRRKLMRLHSAAHIIYFLFAEKTGIKKLIGSNIEENKARLDFQYPEPIVDMLPKVEEKASQIFSQDIEIKTFPEGNDENRRLWECKEWKCPCGGTHVKSTKEIGKVQLKRKNIGSGKERIEITLSE